MTRMPVAAVVARTEVNMRNSNERIMITINDDDAKAEQGQHTNVRVGTRRLSVHDRNNISSGL